MSPERIQELVALGVYYPHDPSDLQDPGAADRRALLEFLVEEVGVSDAELVAAQAEDRLFALAGDRQVRHGSRSLSVAEAADRLGVPTELVRRTWRAYGLPSLPEEGPALSESDLGLVQLVRDSANFFGLDAALRLARVSGAGLARLAEAGTAAIFGVMEEMDLARSGSEVVTARAFHSLAALVPSIGRSLDIGYRHHLESSRRHFESVVVDHESGLTIATGFADLSGFTLLSAERPLPALSRLLAAFEERASDTVHSGGGRVVKFLGDAVMYVCSSPARAADIALDLVHDPVAAQLGIAVRAGIGWGPTIAQDGDYFGPSVNLAARLVAVAEPSTVLADPSTAALLGDLRAEVQPAVQLRGIAHPVAPLLVTR
jgi:adenylate cyclase